jgi:pimeloyl-ACP methyl ester carboxylesterase
MNRHPPRPRSVPDRVDIETMPRAREDGAQTAADRLVPKTPKEASPMSMHSRIDHRRSRRTLIRTTAVGLVVVAGEQASSRSLVTARLWQSPVPATPDEADGLAGTPLGEQLAWFLAAMNDAGASLTEADVEAHMAPSLLAVLPPAQVIATIQGLAAGYGVLTLQGVTRPPTPTQAVALVTSQMGLPLAVPIAVEDAASCRITGLNVYPVPTATGEPLLPLPHADLHNAGPANLVDVGGRSLYHSDTGTNGPTVVLESGLGDAAAPWSGLIPGIAAFARVVSYDRPNTEASASDPAPAPRTGADVVTDLHAMLEGAALPGPYVLVGHSIGGIFVRLYASRYPDDVAGLVLVDASHEDQVARLEKIAPPELVEMVIEATTTNAEGIELDASFAQVKKARTASPLQPMPLIVLGAGQIDPARWPEGWPLEEQAQLDHELQEDLANLVPDGRLIIADQSGHYIHQTQPDLVLDAIRQVVEAVRDPTSWATPLAATPAP